MTKQSRYDFDYVFPQWDVSIARPVAASESEVKKDRNRQGQRKRSNEKAS
jgi:hypothetical protein